MSPSRRRYRVVYEQAKAAVGTAAESARRSGEWSPVPWKRPADADQPDEAPDAPARINTRTCYSASDSGRVVKELYRPVTHCGVIGRTPSIASTLRTSCIGTMSPARQQSSHKRHDGAARHRYNKWGSSRNPARLIAQPKAPGSRCHPRPGPANWSRMRKAGPTSGTSRYPPGTVSSRVGFWLRAVPPHHRVPGSPTGSTCRRRHKVAMNKERHECSRTQRVPATNP